MEKIKIDIINDTKRKEIVISTDFGEFQVYKSNPLILQLLKCICMPDRYRIDIIEK